MDKITYLAELAEGLARWVPERERQDILRYYAEYFDEAGPGREAEVIAELGDPWALSCRLAVEGGYVTQDAANAWKPPRGRRKAWPFVLAGTLAAVLIIAVSVASFMSLVGGFVGRFIGRTVEEATVIDQVRFGDIAAAGKNGPDAVWYEAPELGGFWSMEDGSLEPFYAIDADISMGNIIVTSGEDYTLAIQQVSSLGGYTVEWELQGDTLKIRDSGSEGGHIGLDGLEDLFGQNGLDVIITAPEGSVLQKVAVKTDLGGVFLSDLDVERGVSAETKAGDVDAYELRTAEKIELKTAMGNINFGADGLYNYHTGVSIELKTNLGNVDASLDCYEQKCGYKLETGLGRVTVNGRNCGTKAERKADAAIYKLDAGSDLGEVNVYFYD